mmetsp:Transcript_9808/g.28457  ORF Transcript_9808/g.28457 Transcript_9808/m.28457 type:complete len:237 (+) Transcript_9808:126-836(+)
MMEGQALSTRAARTGRTARIVDRARLCLPRPPRLLPSRPATDATPVRNAVSASSSSRRVSAQMCLATTCFPCAMGRTLARRGQKSAVFAEDSVNAVLPHPTTTASSRPRTARRSVRFTAARRAPFFRLCHLGCRPRHPCRQVHPRLHPHRRAHPHRRPHHPRRRPFRPCRARHPYPAAHAMRVRSVAYACAWWTASSAPIGMNCLTSILVMRTLRSAPSAHPPSTGSAGRAPVPTT